MKVKVVTREVKETELDREYPLFLHLEYEYRDEEYWAFLGENRYIVVKFFLNDVSIRTLRNFEAKHYFDINDECTKDEFMEAYNNALKFIAL